MNPSTDPQPHARLPLWWASHHRIHHQTSDTKGDIHSPRQHGFWWAHIGWVMKRELMETRFERIREFARYPELMWLVWDMREPPRAVLAERRHT